MKPIKAYQSQQATNTYLQPVAQEIPFLHDTDPQARPSERLIAVMPECRYQEIIGFGGSFTESSAYNFSLMSRASQEKILTAYFDKEEGLNYNFCRTHIHSCDFSLERYTYVAEGDKELKTFDIGQDRKYIIPFIKAAQKLQGDDLWLFASPWSPPGWMKDTGEIVRGGRLLEEYYPVWAAYFAKYLAHYKREGIPFFGVSVQNEPLAWQTWESCKYTGEEEGIFATRYLKPALRAAGFDDIKIMIWDHNKDVILRRAQETFSVPGAIDNIWGVAFHWYTGDHFEQLEMTHKMFPDKPLILSEYCMGVEIGEAIKGPHATWAGLERYAHELIGNFNHYMAAEVDWNMILDENGGPFHDRDEGCKALIVVDPATDKVTLEPTYYAVGHFSRFVQRGAVRIGSSSLDERIKTVAFQNPDESLVLVLLNQIDHDQKLDLRVGNHAAKITLPKRSMHTFVF